MKSTRLKPGVSFCLSSFLVWFSGSVVGQVSPANVDITLGTGESFDVNKIISIPAVPSNVEICLVADVSGSFFDDIVNLKAQTDAITAVLASADSALFGLATFADYPVSPYGNSTDLPYELITSLTDPASWAAAVDTLVANGGGDGRESQLDAIVGAAIGLDPYGGSCGWSGDMNTTKIIIGTTDDSCHEPDISSGKPHVNSTDDVIAKLVSEEVTFIGLAAGSGAQACFQPIADATGGVVEDLAADGSNISTAISAAIEEISYDVVPMAVAGCEDLVLGYTPTEYLGVGAGDSLNFLETITYIGSGAGVNCEVSFAPAGVQTINVTAEVGDGGEGCTPGYWKQKHHYDSWDSHAPSDRFNDVFHVGPASTLVATLKRGGGKFTALNRHAVAAMLNATSDGVSYDYSSTEVVGIVQDAYASGDWKSAKRLLETANELGCPLN